MYGGTREGLLVLCTTIFMLNMFEHVKGGFCTLKYTWNKSGGPRKVRSNASWPMIM